MTPYLISLLSVMVVFFGPAGESLSVWAQQIPAAPPVAPGVVPPPPPLSQARPAVQVFYTVNGQTFGPLNADQLGAKIAAGEIGPQTLVWMEGMAGWQAASAVAALAPFLAPTTPAPAGFDAKRYMAGTWEQSDMVALEGIGQAQVNTSMTFRADGSVTGYGTMLTQTYYGPISLTISSQGTWTVQPKSDNSFVLTPNMQVTTSGPSGAPSTSTNTTPVLLTVVDQNTVSNSSGTRSYRVGP